MDCGWLFVHRYDEKIRLFFFEAEQHLVIFGVQILWQDSTVSDQQRQHLALERILSWLPTSFLADGADDPLAGVADMQEFGRDEAAAGAGFAGRRAERFNGADDDIHHDVTSLQDVHREREFVWERVGAAEQCLVVQLTKRRTGGVRLTRIIVEYTCFAQLLLQTRPLDLTALFTTWLQLLGNPFCRCPKTENAVQD